MTILKTFLPVVGAAVSIFLIIIVLLRVPQENVGLASFANKSNVLGSPSSTERFLNNATMTGIFIYLAIAFQLNLLNLNDFFI